MKTHHILLVILILSASFGLTQAETYFVDDARPDDSGSGLTWADAKKTISAAIAVSAAGDTILVKYGTYHIPQYISITSNRKITSDDGNNITWGTAQHNSSQCIILAHHCRIFTILSGAVSHVTHIRGFKITGGNATTDTVFSGYGGGLLVADSAAPVIEYCRVTQDTAKTSSGIGFGGGIAMRGEGSEPLIQYCHIDSNIASTSWHGYGGGIFSDGQSSPTIYHNIIIANSGSIRRSGNGGGIYCSSSLANIWGNQIVYNVGSAEGASGGGLGGGIYVFSGNVKIRQNTIEFNTASNATSGYGGGIYIQAQSGEVWENNILYNRAATREEGSGGGIISDGGGLYIHDNLIAHNIANSASSGPSSWKRGKGGGAVVHGIFENNIVGDNTASVHGQGQGGGIYFSTGSHIAYNLIYHNVASDSGDGYGGGAWGYNAGGGILTNNTFFENANETAGSGAGRGSGLYYWHGGYNFNLKNNIFCNHNLAGSDGTAIHFDVPFTIRNNCFYQNGTNYNTNITSKHEILGDPRFTDAANSDFTLLFDSPCIDAGSDTLSYDETTTHDQGWMVDIGAEEYTGVRVMKTISGPGEYLFGGQVRAKINVSTPGSLTAIDLTVHPGETHSNAPSSVQRWYQATPTGGGATFDLTLSYKDTELNNESETDLKLWQWDGANWNGPGFSSDTSTVENWLTIPGLSSFGEWVLADADSAIALPVDEKPVTAHKFHLLQNYPNPFNPVTSIQYSVSSSQEVILIVYDLLGRKVKTLVKERKPAGRFTVQWDGSNDAGQPVPSGVYLYRLKAGKYTAVRKMLLVR